MQKSVKVTMKSTRKCDLFYQARNNDLPVTHLNINLVVKLIGVTEMEKESAQRR